MTGPVSRPLGAQPVAIPGHSMRVREITYRRIDDGQTVRVHGAELPQKATHHDRRHDHVDVVLPANNGSHLTGLILRFRDPLDLDAFIRHLDDALEVLRERRAAIPAVSLVSRADTQPANGSRP